MPAACRGEPSSTSGEGAETVTDDRIERIRERAHQIWENEGKPEGRDAEHWEQAKREIDSEGSDGENGGAEAGDGEAVTAAGGQGVASGLQSGGSVPSGGPGASAGSIGSGGGSTAGRATGGAKRRAGSGGSKSSGL
jgi:hypothetical protein